jgi:glutaconate CoA-transferase subunit B
VHPGHSVEEIVENTGFDFDRPASVPQTPAVPADWLLRLHGAVRAQVAETYPQFAATRLGGA